MKKLTFIAAAVFALTGCNEAEIAALKTENTGLKNEVQTLKVEVSKLQETADFHFKNGQDFLASKDWESAVKSFDTVIRKYPNSPLLTSAKTSLEVAESARQASLKEAEEREREARAASERETAENGEVISYGSFFAKYKTGITAGKRYKFTACYSTASSCVISPSMSVDQNICDITPQFDDKSEYQNWLSEGSKYCGPIVASVLYPGELAIHRLH